MLNTRLKLGNILSCKCHFETKQRSFEI